MAYVWLHISKVRFLRVSSILEDSSDKQFVPVGRPYLPCHRGSETSDPRATAASRADCFSPHRKQLVILDVRRCPALTGSKHLEMALIKDLHLLLLLGPRRLNPQRA